jgi:hypothetical protein
MGKSILENDDFSYYEIERRIEDLFPSSEFNLSFPNRFDVLGVPSIFYKLAEKIRRSSRLICPHCGKEGRLMTKLSIVKGKYRYRKLYVYHETYLFKKPLGRRVQKWCYLNIKDLKNRAIIETLERWRYASNIRKWFYKSLIVPKKGLRKFF